MKKTIPERKTQNGGTPSSSRKDKKKKRKSKDFNAGLTLCATPAQKVKEDLNAKTPLCSSTPLQFRMSKKAQINVQKKTDDKNKKERSNLQKLLTRSKSKPKNSTSLKDILSQL